MSRLFQRICVVMLCILLLGGCAANPVNTSSISSDTVSVDSANAESDSKTVSEISADTDNRNNNIIIPDGLYCHYSDNNNGYGYNQIYKAELSFSNEEAYFRLIDATNAQVPSVLLTATAPIDYKDGKFFATFKTEYNTITVKMFDYYTFEAIFNGNLDEDEVNGIYYYDEPYFPMYSSPTVIHDKSTPNGSMDAGIADAVRHMFAMSPDAELTDKDCAKITELNLIPGSAPVTSLDGIEYFVNLKSLNVSESYISDISAINKLPKLESISFSSNMIETLPDLSGCKMLKNVSFTDERITDISSLAQLPKLETVMLVGNYIKSIAPLKDNHTIKSICLNGNCISDWECLADNDDMKKALTESYDEYLEVQNKAKEILAKTITDDMSDLEKEVRIAKYIEDFMEYDEDTGDKEGYTIYHYGILENKGVCQNYAYAANLEGKWYEFDCTWDDGHSIETWYWFNKSRAAMNRSSDHQIVNPELNHFANQTMPFSDYCKFAED